MMLCYNCGEQFPDNQFHACPPEPTIRDIARKLDRITELLDKVAREMETARLMQWGL